MDLFEFLVVVGPGQYALAVEHARSGGQDRLPAGGHGRVDQRERGQGAGVVAQDGGDEQGQVVGPVGVGRPGEVRQQLCEQELAGLVDLVGGGVVGNWG